MKKRCKNCQYAAWQQDDEVFCSKFLNYQSSDTFCGNFKRKKLIDVDWTWLPLLFSLVAMVLSIIKLVNG